MDDFVLANPSYFTNEDLKELLGSAMITQDTFNTLSKNSNDSNN